MSGLSLQGIRRLSLGESWPRPDLVTCLMGGGGALMQPSVDSSDQAVDLEPQDRRFRIQYSPQAREPHRAPRVAD